MSLRISRFFKISAILLVLVCAGGVFLDVQAQESQSEEQIEQRRAELRKELEKINEEIDQQQSILNERRQERRSLERDIAILDAEIRQSELKIRKLNISIGELSDEIVGKEQTISELNEKLDREKQSLAQLLRKQNEVDSVTLVEVVLGNEDFSDFFRDIDAFASLNAALQKSFERIRTLKTEAQTQKQQLQSTREQQMNARAEVEAEQRKIERNKAEKAELVAIKRSQEQTYEGLIAQRQQRAREIRAALFELRQARSIPFGDALEYARQASAKTGVRPAFILGVLRQESNLGENVGQCYLTDPQTGAGVGKNTGRQFQNVMKPSRDVQPFMRITQELGLNYSSTPVSCPQGFGYGGAMGPSQFIPSTWQMYEPGLQQMLGITPNPWEPEHAFMATAIFLRDLGASAQTYSAEREAAARYYAGGNWRVHGLGYADSVLSHAQDIQENMIDPLEEVEG